MSIFDPFDNKAAELKAKMSNLDATFNDINTRLEASKEELRYRLMDDFVSLARGDRLSPELTVVLETKATLAVRIETKSLTEYTPIERLEYRAQKLGVNGLIDIHTEMGHLVGKPVVIGVFDKDGKLAEELVPAKARKNLHFTADEIGLVKNAKEKHKKEIDDAYSRGRRSGYSDGLMDSWAFL